MSSIRRIYRLRRFDRPESQKLRSIQIWWIQRLTPTKYRTPEYPNRTITDIHGTTLRRKARDLHFSLFANMTRPYKRTRRSGESILKFILSLLFLAFVPSLFFCSCTSIPIRDSPVPQTPLRFRGVLASPPTDPSTQGDLYLNSKTSQLIQYWHDTAQWQPIQSDVSSTTQTVSIPARTEAQARAAMSSAMSATPNLASCKILFDLPADPDLKGVRAMRSEDQYSTPVLFMDITTTPTILCVVAEDGDTSIVQNGKVCGLIDARLDPGKRYWYTLCAYDISGNVSEPALLDIYGARIRVRFAPIPGKQPTNVKIFALPWK